MKLGGTTFALLAFFLSVVAVAPALAGPEPEPGCLDPISIDVAGTPCASRARSQVIGTTLYVDGRVDAMTYDLVTREPDNGQGILRVELNSFGGSTLYGELISGFIRRHGLITSLREDAVCMSACVQLLQAGTIRVARPSAVIGLHGVRSSRGYVEEYLAACNVSQAVCNAYSEKWRKESLAETRKFFKLMERHGASPQLFRNYLKQGPDDDDWWRKGNGLQIKDWPLTPEEAFGYNVLSQYPRKRLD